MSNVSNPSYSNPEQVQRATIAIDTGKGTFHWFHFTAQQLAAGGGVQGVQDWLRDRKWVLKWEPVFKNPEKWAAIYWKPDGSAE